MSIRPVDFGMIQNSQEVGNVRQNENQRPIVEQQTMQIAQDQQQEIQKDTVARATEKDDENRYDAAEGEGGGNASYQGKGRKKKEAEEEKKDRVVIKGQGGGFNISI